MSVTAYVISDAPTVDEIDFGRHSAATSITEDGAIDAAIENADLSPGPHTIALKTGDDRLKIVNIDVPEPAPSLTVTSVDGAVDLNRKPRLRLRG